MYFELKPDESGNLHPINEEMPCSPRQIRIWHWALPNTLQRAEREEAAARLIAFSVHFGAWVGVTFARIGEMCMADIEAQDNAAAVRRANYAEEQRVAKANKQRLGWRNILTFGWYARTHPEQTAVVLDVPSVPFTGIYIFGARHIITGLQELRDEGMVRIETVGENDVIYPTEKLVRRIMDVQKIAA